MGTSGYTGLYFSSEVIQETVKMYRIFFFFLVVGVSVYDEAEMEQCQ